MTIFANRKSAAGFSLIEVLVAVVIMSIGLVALAALQLNLIRSASTAKAQSIGLSLGKQQIEKLRSFQTLNDYIALDSSSTTGSCGTTPVNCIGGAAYSVATTITRYVLNGTSYTQVSNTTPEYTLSADTTQNYVVGRDFKKASVAITWTDSNNASNSLTLDDVVDGLTPADSAKVVKNTSNGAPRNAKVIILNPANTAGVIPIAIGNSTDTAATNPKPVVDSSATETRFNIITYAALSGGDALAQSEVETVLIGCTCDTATAPTDTTTRGYRPTYWNGFRYVAPTLATYVPPAGQAAIKHNGTSESPYCDVCCRDHNDPSGTTTAKFSPFRSTHTHYGVDSSGTLVAVGGGQTTYMEACRLIRTDGILRVAADYNDEYFDLLKTKNDGSTTEYAPADSAITNYQGFVLNYLNDKVVTNGVPSTYNTPVAAGTVSSLEATYNINDPTSITIQRINDHKWLHTRGLYIDYLEPEALAAIKDAKANCVSSGCSSSDTQTAVLKLLPFTSVNVTELSDWTPLVGAVNRYIAISNALSFLGSTAYIGGAPIRGYTTPATTGIPDSAVTDIGTSILRNSNSGLQVLYDFAINNDEGSKSDTQPFAIPAGSPSTGITFTVGSSTYTFKATIKRPQVVLGSVVTACSYNAGTPDTVFCNATGGALTLTITNYNYDSGSSGVSGLNLSCTDSAGLNPPLSYITTSSDKVEVCKNFSLDSITDTAGTTVTSNAPVGSGLTQTTSTDFTSTPTVAPNDNLQLTFSKKPDTYNETCTYTTSSKSGKTTFNVTAIACP